jgi:hypothetical protein
LAAGSTAHGPIISRSQKATLVPNHVQAFGEQNPPGQSRAESLAVSGRLPGSLKHDLSYRSLVLAYRTLTEFADHGWLGDLQFIPSQTDGLNTRSD